MIHQQSIDNNQWPIAMPDNLESIINDKVYQVVNDLESIILIGKNHNLGEGSTPQQLKQQLMLRLLHLVCQGDAQFSR